MLSTTASLDVSIATIDFPPGRVSKFVRLLATQTFPESSIIIRFVHPLMEIFFCTLSSVIT
ncbi:MAG: hypothetical protein RMM53_02375, partial [Bacteroidia bacterium]|nr:hypothetical protein [Bacteroidia bacterium]